MLDKTYHVAFVQSRSISELEVGNRSQLSFDGSGIFGLDDRTDTIGDATIGHGSSLDLKRITTTRDINIDVADALTVDGTLRVLDSSIATAARTTLDSISSNFTALMQVWGTDGAMEPSQLRTTHLTVGMEQRGRLAINGGGFVASDYVAVGENQGSFGDVQVRGSNLGGSLRSTWNVSNSATPVVIGERGRGFLTVQESGYVITSNVEVGKFSGGSGAITLAGHPNRLPQWFNSGKVYVGGSATAAGGTGLLSLQAPSRTDIPGTLKVWAGGRVELTGGNLQTNQIDHTGGGQCDFLGGTLQFNRFDGDLVHQAGVLTPGPGADGMIIDGDYTQQTNAILQMEIGGLAPGLAYDRVDVLGDVVLDGNLFLSVIDSYEPAPTNEFSILVADSIITGQFDNVASGDRLETTDGSGSFVVHYGSNSPFNQRQIFLADFQSNTFFPGDYDGDLDVDGRDFSYWQRNDGSGMGLSTCKNNYGNVAVLCAANASVPEPSSLGLFAIGSVALAFCHRKMC